MATHMSTEVSDGVALTRKAISASLSVWRR
jgi:hypothetical protein